LAVNCKNAVVSTIFGRVPVVPYTKPGSPDAEPLIRARTPDHPVVLLANHGPVVAGTSLESAVFAAEELE
jgi:ribulose-5-phosphate 4-epimerase/fuculose-1-phosphate aldolase